jgi:hypothetical protein
MTLVSGQGGPVALCRRIFGLSLLSGALFVLQGCSLAPKNFQGITKDEPLVRARAIPMGRKLSDDKVMPHLINSLDDHDQVVRLAANEELKKRSGQDFGYVPYAEPKDRQPAVSQWRAWWAARQVSFPQLRRRRDRQVSPPIQP